MLLPRKSEPLRSPVNQLSQQQEQHKTKKKYTKRKYCALVRKFAPGTIFALFVWVIVTSFHGVLIYDDSKISRGSTTIKKTLLTVREMKEQMNLPCNYVHDGFYLGDSNEVLNQVYQTLMEMQDDMIPILVECGGHDGITKSLSLKSSICLNMNTMLIEASQSNFNILKQTRKYDFTVNAALCEGDSIQMSDNPTNSGENHVTEETKLSNGITTACTSIDYELSKLKILLPKDQQDKIKLIFLVLDVEGYEATAIQGNTQYSPAKVMMEGKYAKETDRIKIEEWTKKHRLEGKPCTNNDICYNFHPSISEKPSHLKSLFYGARSKIPDKNYKTSVASKAYMFYGK